MVGIMLILTFGAGLAAPADSSDGEDRLVVHRLVDAVVRRAAAVHHPGAEIITLIMRLRAEMLETLRNRSSSFAPRPWAAHRVVHWLRTAFEGHHGRCCRSAT